RLAGAAADLQHKGARAHACEDREVVEQRGWVPGAGTVVGSGVRTEGRPQSFPGMVGRAPRPTVAGRSARPPAPGPRRPPAITDPLRRWPRAVGAAGRGFAAAGGKLRRPHRAGPLIALLDSRMQRPLWIVEMWSAERTQIGTTGQDERVHVVIGRNRADRDR